MKIRNVILMMLAICLACSCKQVVHPSTVTAGASVCVDTSNSSCPHITKDNKNRIVLSWIRSYSDSSAVVCYATLNDDGKTFGPVTEIPCSKNVFPHGENMPKMLYKKDGEMIAAWGCSNPNPKNPYSGLVYYTLSFDQGKTWVAPKCVTADSASIDQRYFDLALLPSGEAAIVWLDNRTKTDKEGSTLYFATTRGKEGFSGEAPIATTCCQCCRTCLFVDTKGQVRVAFRGIIDDSIRDMVHIVSADNGKTFSAPKRISDDNWVIKGCPHTGPSMTDNGKGIQFAWYTGGNNGGIYFCGTDNGQNFQGRDSVVKKAATKHPQIISLKNGQLLIVWDEVVANGEKYNSSIGLQLRNEWGHKVLTEYVTANEASASFPVIARASDSTALLAYTLKRNDKNSICYKLLSVK